MRAIYIQQHGPIANLKVSDVPVPSISANEVLVRVEASGINPSDAASVEGRFSHGVLPRIVGRDFAGTIVQGPAELIGMKVWGSGGDLGITRNGTHADYIAIPRQAAAPRPKNLTVEEGGRGWGSLYHRVFGDGSPWRAASGRMGHRLRSGGSRWAGSDSDCPCQRRARRRPCARRD